ncbi:MAG: hypothetical protein HYS27_11870 [Deltaproteobacteria bacterium]|nr:hypothetical protein [Deltaproteobacteria bacterium]
MRATKATASSIVLAVCGAAANLACTNFDREDRIEDMRVLAVRMEPPEILYSPLFLQPAAQRPPGFPLPTVDVQLEFFAFDPRGGRVETSVQLCPDNAEDNSCRIYDPSDDVAAEPPAARDELAALLTPVVTESEIAADATPIGRVLPATATWHLTPPVIDFFIDDDNRGNPIPSIFPQTPRVVVEARNLDIVEPAEVQKERAFKRLPISIDLTSPELPPSVVEDLAEGLGITLCEAPIPDEEFLEQGRASCLERRLPNHNPGLLGFKIEPDPEQMSEGYLSDVAPDLGIGSLLRADPGALIAVTPVFTPDASEQYQVISFDIDTSKIILLNRVEDLACTWYSTRGDVSASLTALQQRDALGVTWRLPFEAQAGERDSMVLVVLDQRGGTAVGEITVEYR